MFDPAVERLLIAMEVQNAALIAIELDGFGGHHLVEHGLRIGGETMLEQSIPARFFGRAFQQEQPGPGIEPGIGGEFETQRLILDKQRLQQNHRRLRRRPHEGVPRRYHAGIAPARARGEFVGALENDDVMAVLLQLIGAGDADDASAENHYPHHARPLPRCISAG